MAELFPHQYEVGLRWDRERRGFLTAPPRPEILGGPPPEFGGQDLWWSPEHLLLGSAALCLMATFLTLAAKSRLDILGYRCAAAGTLDKTPSGYAFTSITLDVSLQVKEGEKERAEKLLETAKRHCIVANSMKVAVTLETEVVAGQEAAA